MPDAIRRPCVAPGCPGYAEFRGRCAEHARLAEQHRGTTKQRGYAAGWRAARAFVLQRDGYACQLEIKCGKGAGRSEPDNATEVDHILPVSTHPELRLRLSNLRASCTACNAAKGGRYPA